jgi:hypothetical protein
MFKKIVEKLKDFVCSDLPKPISNEQHEADIKRNIRYIVKNTSQGNTSLQQGRYITESDLNRLREKNFNYRFTGK